MNKKNEFPKFLKVASLLAPKVKPYALTTQNVSVIHVKDAQLITILAESLRFSTEIRIPADGEIGKELPGGQWTGMVGMVQRSETDVAIGRLSIIEERLKFVSFTYPYHQTFMTFMTDKPQPLLVSSTLFDPFSFGIWAALISSLILVSLLIRTFMKGRPSYSNVLYMLCGGLFGQPMNFKTQTLRTRSLVFSWLVCAFLIANCYKAIISAVLAFPYMSGVKDLADLSRAASEKSVRCYTMKGSYLFKSLLQANDESLRRIGECLKLDEEHAVSLEDFENVAGRKAYLSGEWLFRPYENEFFISEDCIFLDLNAITVPKNFCCLEKLNFLVHRITQAGLYEKILRDIQFLIRLQHLSRAAKHPESHRVILLKDISVTFLLLGFGYSLAITILFLEMFSKKLPLAFARQCLHLASQSRVKGRIPPKTTKRHFY